MELISKYNVGDYLQAIGGNGWNRSFGEANTLALRVVYIHSETCSAGTQIFYLCRAILVRRSKRNEFAKDNDACVTDVSILLDPITQNKFREDEVMPCPADIVAWIGAGTSVDKEVKTLPDDE